MDYAVFEANGRAWLAALRVELAGHAVSRVWLEFQPVGVEAPACLCEASDEELSQMLAEGSDPDEQLLRAALGRAQQRERVVPGP